MDWRTGSSVYRVEDTNHDDSLHIGHFLSIGSLPDLTGLEVLIQDVTASAILYFQV
jgi:hypothetical protein